MSDYMVYATTPNSGRTIWDLVGVFSADDTLTTGEQVDKVCRAAAKKRGSTGLYFAMEGYRWGLAIDSEDDVAELGKERSIIDVVAERERIDLERSRIALERERLQLNAPDITAKVARMESEIKNPGGADAESTATEDA